MTLVSVCVHFLKLLDTQTQKWTQSLTKINLFFFFLVIFIIRDLCNKKVISNAFYLLIEESFTFFPNSRSQFSTGFNSIVAKTWMTTKTVRIWSVEAWQIFNIGLSVVTIVIILMSVSFIGQQLKAIPLFCY